ncbi:unnamed protein product [Protopolystoma xenopodis]|uniref:Discoidin domain-containing protein n=1 Tax=Protopolystoma xenopodis TaxID=117903 RepID=A0A448WAY8_9PLAT|nr:unnamed protein product [Protopolystoma xenopodis]
MMQYHSNLFQFCTDGLVEYSMRQGDQVNLNITLDPPDSLSKSGPLEANVAKASASLLAFLDVTYDSPLHMETFGPTVDSSARGANFSGPAGASVGAGELTGFSSVHQTDFHPGQAFASASDRLTGGLGQLVDNRAYMGNVTRDALLLGGHHFVGWQRRTLGLDHEVDIDFTFDTCMGSMRRKLRSLFALFMLLTGAIIVESISSILPRPAISQLTTSVLQAWAT